TKGERPPAPPSADLRFDSAQSGSTERTGMTRLVATWIVPSSSKLDGPVRRKRRTPRVGRLSAATLAAGRSNSPLSASEAPGPMPYGSSLRQSSTAAPLARSRITKRLGVAATAGELPLAGSALLPNATAPTHVPPSETPSAARGG